MDKLKMQSHDVIGSNTHKIAQLFPNCVTERLGKDGKPELAIDFEKLQAELSNEILAEGEERYQFTWPDKRKAIRTANTPTTMTLRPNREESVDFDHTENLYIEGDNLDVLKVLRETYLGKVKMIYIDPPYNTGNDFVYNDDFAQSKGDYEEGSGFYDEEGNQTLDPMQRNNESNGRFHTDWLNMIYPRLKVARDLLTDDGVIFISIDDNEQENLKKICDEIFGGGNFVGQFIRRSINSGKHDSTTVSVYHEHLVLYCKNIANVKLNRREKTEEERKKLYPLEDEYVNSRGRYYISQLDKGSIQYSDSLNYPIIAPDGSEVWAGNGFEDKTRVFRWSKEKVKWGIERDYIVFKKQKDKWKVYAKSYEFRDNNDYEIIPSNPYTTLDYVAKEFSNFSATPELQKIFEGKNFFDFPKPIIFIKDIIKYATNPNDLILDFFSGSATTAHAVMKLNAEDGGNRKFIMVQLPEKTDEKSEAYKAGYRNICEIGKERIRRAGQKIKEEHPEAKDLDTGFRVLKLDTSNMAEVYYTPQEFDLNELFDQNIKQDRSNEDLLFQVMLDLGIELSVPIESKEIGSKEVHFVDDNYLITCFDEEVSEATITEIAKLQPIYFVMCDASAKTDSVMDNFEQIFRYYSPETICRVI